MNTPETYQTFMLDYTSGNLSASMSVAATIHRLMSSEGDETAQIWDAVRTALSDTAYERRDAFERMEAVAADIIHTDYDAINWRRSLSGACVCKLSHTSGSLMRLYPGGRVFEHGHSALEAMIVLEGALEDGRARFEAGDLVLAERGVRHHPAAAGNTPCTCFVARAETPFWRFT